MEKISSILFTKDNAAQLKVFLDSVEKNAKNIFDLNIIISYTNDEYKKGYEKIICDNKYNGIKFIYSKSDYKKDVIEIIKNSNDYFTFFLDDDVIYDKINIIDIINSIQEDDDVVCFSLRLGKNTTKCYTLGVDNVIHDVKEHGGFIKWDWKLHYLDFGYPFSVNGHVFRKKDIYKIIKKINFNSVEELEVGLFDFSEMFPRNIMISYKKSKLVNIPISRVQQSIEDEMVLTIKENQCKAIRKKINEIFLLGEFINLENINFSNIEGCHQDLNLGGSYGNLIEK